MIASRSACSACFALVFAVLVVVLRQPMRAALALIAHMISLAAIFACLNVHVVALFQVLIYVGAVMVLMIYTIMLLDDSDPSYVKVFSRWSVPAIVVAAMRDGGVGVVARHAPHRDAPAVAQPATGAVRLLGIFHRVHVALLAPLRDRHGVARYRHRGRMDRSFLSECGK